MVASTSSFVGHLFSRLEKYARLSAEDRAALQTLACASLLEVQPRRDLVREGDRPNAVRLVVSGWACRYKGLPDGRRQILGFLVPGDFCDLNVTIVRKMDHSIGAVTRVQYATLPTEEIDRVAEERPQVARAIWWHELVDASVQREWLLNIGQRSAYERIAHLLVELHLRLGSIGRTRDGSCDFPLTQTDLAEATGLTAVHVNRTLQELRRDNLIELSHRRLTIPDLPRLMQVAAFNTNYLHLDEEAPPPQLDS